MPAPELGVNPAFTLFSDDALGFAIRAARSEASDQARDACSADNKERK